MRKTSLPKHALLITLQYLLTAALLAQPPKQWDYRFGGTNGDQMTSLQQTTDGGYILGGYSSSDIGGDKTQNSRGIFDYWVIKINANGVKQWDKRFGGIGYDNLYCLQQTKDGGYILGGWTGSPKGKDITEDDRGIYDYWVVKIDAKGNKQWDKRFGGYSIQSLTSLQQTSDGGYILGGYTDSDTGLDVTQKSRGQEDYWMVKIDANGVKQWDKRFGGGRYEYLKCIQQTLDGGYILGGYTASNSGGDITEGQRGFIDYWIVKTDANGVKQWDKRFGGGKEDRLFSLEQTADGGYILGGYSRSGISGDKTQGSRGSSDYWVIKIDANGLKQWDKRFGGTNTDELGSVEQTPDGGYILGGYSSSGIGGDRTEESRGGSDYWILKIDANGAKQWDKCFGGSGEDLLASARHTTDDGYILGGHSASGISGDKTQDTWGLSSDYWIVKLGCPPNATVTRPGNLDLCQTDSIILHAYSADGYNYQWLKDNQKITGATDSTYLVTEPGVYRVVVSAGKQCKDTSKTVKIISSCRQSSNNISISPNPSHGMVTLTYNSTKAGTVQLNVYDKTGRLIFSKAERAVNGSNLYQLNLSHVINGIYNIQVVNGSRQSQVRVVIEK